MANTVLCCWFYCADISRMEMIERWLSGSRNFIIGKTLYLRYGQDGALKKALTGAETPALKVKLLQAMQALCAAGAKTPAPTTDKGEKMPDAPNDSILQSIAEDWKAKYAKMKYLQYELDKYGSDNSDATRNTCHEICKQILALEKEINALWDKRDYYVQHGTVPDVKTNDFTIPEDPFKHAKLIDNLTKYVRRYRLICTNEPGNSKAAALLKKYQDQLNICHGKKD